MPRLLQMNSTLGRGSTGRIAEQISAAAHSEGWDSYIAHGPRFVGETNALAYQVTGRIGELGHILQSRIFDRHGLGSSRETKRLLSWIDNLQPDVVHIHNIHGYYVNYDLLLGYLAKKEYPTVITMHDFWLMTGHCAYINKRCDKWKTGCGQCPRLREYPASVLDRSRKNFLLKKELFTAFKKGKLVLVPVSEWLAGYARESLLGECNIVPIPNGINVNVFRPFEGEHSGRCQAIDWDKYTIITVADRWTGANGFGDIIRLSGILPDDMQIVMVGLNEKQLRDLPHNIIGIGHTDNVAQLVELYSAADVLFNASTEVTFGMVTAEAMACGTPAIVLRGTAGDEIVDEATGFAVDTIEEIPELVYRCRAQAAQYKSKCRERIVREFNAVAQYSKYIALYNRFFQ